MKIYLFGNPLVDFDNLPMRLLPELQKAFPGIDFVVQDPNENLRPERGELNIIDTVIGPKEAILIEDIEKIELSPSCSLHDFDLGFNLKLLKKIGRLDKVKIFGIPSGLDEKKALKQLITLLKNI